MGEASGQASVLARCVGDEDEWVRTHTAESLLLMGTPFSPRVGDLIKSLDSEAKDPEGGISRRGHHAHRRRALQALGQRGVFAAPYTREIASCLQDSDQGVRR